MSTSNNRRLVESGKRFRGGVSVDVDASHAPSLPPLGPLSGDPEGVDWCGHGWSAWERASEIARLVAREARGLYRLRVPGQAGLVYIGQGRVASRVTQHLGKVGNPREPQGGVFRAEMEVSRTRNDAWLVHERLELENDLIAAYVVSEGTPPPVQFSAGGGRE